VHDDDHGRLGDDGGNDGGDRGEEQYHDYEGGEHLGDENGDDEDEEVGNADTGYNYYGIGYGHAAIVDSDSYTYSDDSASLSDAYFFPQSDDDLARPPRYRGEQQLHQHQQQRQLHQNERDPLNGSNNTDNNPSAGSFPLASYYGSLYYGATSANINSDKSGGADPRSSPPLWVSGAIQEDSELQEFVPQSRGYQRGPQHPDADAGSSSVANQKAASYSSSSGQHNQFVRQGKGGAGGKKDRRRSRRQPHKQRTGAQQQQQNKLRLRHKEQQIARERAVARVRGRVQKEEWRDVLYAFLFLLQLAAVVVCAIAFGFHLVESQSTNADTDTSSGGGDTATATHTKTVSSVSLVNNSTLGQVVYTDDAVYDRTNHGGSPSSFSTTSSSSSPASASTEPSVFFFMFDYQNVVELVVVTGFYACILTYISFGFMLILAKALIQLMLVFSVLLALAWGLIGLSLDPYGVISIIGFAALLLTLGYAMYNWNQIPFAATNLYTALCAMRCTADITILGLASLAVAFAWSVVWSIAFVGLANALNHMECENANACDPHVVWRYSPLFLLLLLSFHWTNTVIKNVIRVTVSSIIATWWFQPDQIGPFCTVAARRALLNSLTTSFGSICQGSLVINFAQTATALTNGCCCLFGNSECMYNSNNNHHRKIGTNGAGPGAGAGSLSSSYCYNVGPVLSDADSATESFGLGRRLCNLCWRVRMYLRSCNRWSFTYIGMYGYGFREGGERAVQLFETREWLSVVRDNLIQNVLVAASIVIGGSAGTFAVVVEETDGYYFSSFHMPTFFAFAIGSILGYVLSNILLLGLVGGAINTVLVCFAAAPFEFEKTHPKLSREMREAWSQHVWEEQPAG